MARGERGQATVEFLGIVPALLVAALAVWQLVLVGHSAWMSAHAARAAARAELVGDDAGAAARSAVPRAMERGMEVSGDDRGVSVRVPVQAVAGAWREPVTVAARASLEAVR
ncbi:MAG TPA: TadE/TadG family type IV pilus assembly protein [Thermoleophilaceae bacterium]|nr:TadE/TadG family type IV pilus assembly protein [Thermoleophilaceae bacterium]